MFFFLAPLVRELTPKSLYDSSRIGSRVNRERRLCCLTRSQPSPGPLETSCPTGEDLPRSGEGDKTETGDQRAERRIGPISTGLREAGEATDEPLFQQVHPFAKVYRWDLRLFWIPLLRRFRQRAGVQFTFVGVRPGEPQADCRAARGMHGVVRGCKTEHHSGNMS